jgi:hypothetical protein
MPDRPTAQDGGSTMTHAQPVAEKQWRGNPMGHTCATSIHPFAIPRVTEPDMKMQALTWTATGVNGGAWMYLFSVEEMQQSCA